MNNEDVENVSSINENEIMSHFGYKGSFGRFRFRIKFLYSWILHSIAYSSPHPDVVIRLQRNRGVRIGKNCHMSPYVLIDLIYPEYVQINDNVTIGSNVMIFAHINPTSNLVLKKEKYPRKVAKVTIKSGAIIFPGSIITAGVTVGENVMVSVGSVVTQDIPDNCIVVGNPARVVKKIEYT